MQEKEDKVNYSSRYSNLKKILLLRGIIKRYFIIKMKQKD